MNWLKAIGFGILLFAVMFVIGSVVMFGLKFPMGSLKASLLMLLAVIIALYLLAKTYKITSLSQGLQVGIVWLIVDAALEYLVIVRMFNNGDTSKLYSWSVYLGYALIVIIPALVGMKKKA